VFQDLFHGSALLTTPTSSNVMVTVQSMALDV